MTIYAVLAPPVRDGSVGPDPDGFAFVKEGFCWPALLLTIPWLIWRRLWLVLVAYLVASIVLASFAEALPPLVAGTMLLLFGFLVGLEANNLRRWTLERRGYRFLGVAEGDRLSEAELRFFSAWADRRSSYDALALAEMPADSAAEPALAPPRSGRDQADSEIVGMFPTAESRT